MSSQEVLDGDILPETDWSLPDFTFEDNESWTKSLKKCYNIFPHNEMAKFEFVFTHDSVEQIYVKTSAAEKALAFFMKKYDNWKTKHPNDPKHREMMFSQANKFFCCLRTFHPLTLHLLSLIHISEPTSPY